MNVTQLSEAIERDAGLSRVLAVAKSQSQSDPSHDLAHSLRVALWVLKLGGGEINFREAVVAALLHDVVNVPKNSPDRAKASALSAAYASEFLPASQFDETAIARIADAIEDHSFSRGMAPRNFLGAVLQDADRLEAVGALGIFRTASCGAVMGAQYLNADDPWARHRSLDDKRYTVDHFFVKLLRLESTFNTEAARVEAAKRTAFMRDFLRQLGDEIGEAPPF